MISEQLHAFVDGRVRSQQELRQEVLERVKAQRWEKRENRSMGKLPAFEPGDNALMVRPRKLGIMPVLVLTWPGPWQVVSGGVGVGSRVQYVVRDIVTDETKDLLAAQRRAWTYSSLVVGSEVREAFKATKHQGEYEMAGILAVGKARGNPGECMVRCSGGLDLRSDFLSKHQGITIWFGRI